MNIFISIGIVVLGFVAMIGVVYFGLGLHRKDDKK